MRLMFNILAISGSAMFAGVMLAIGVTLGGYWKSLPASEFLDWFSQNNRFISRAIPLVVVPTLLGLTGSLWFGWSTEGTRLLWIGAIGCVAALLALTVIWFVPSNSQFRCQIDLSRPGFRPARHLDHASQRPHCARLCHLRAGNPGNQPLKAEKGSRSTKRTASALVIAIFPVSNGDQTCGIM
ncbi:DUF1772 domain-containing protein [Rhizobium leguminosarum]|uniref:DUF1772 domain-containing protein n=1 Tax=Rhizobium leguminosarum TaxID=384 RepID=UPI001C988A8E|nr:DUF1772 domain-containing protein [Rhizobium leguminosarum]